MFRPQAEANQSRRKALEPRPALQQFDRPRDPRFDAGEHGRDRQILHERLGLDPAKVKYIDGDTDRVGWGMGTMGSRSTVIGGTALWRAAEKVVAKGQKIAARLLEAAESDVKFADGKFSVVGTDRAVALDDVARAAFQPPRLPAGMERLTIRRLVVGEASVDLTFYKLGERVAVYPEGQDPSPIPVISHA